jgi:hypothetical protein
MVMIEERGAALLIRRGLTGMIALMALFLFNPPIMAQLPTATILGVVKDASGAVVPGATLTVRLTSTGQTRAAVSGPDGSYRLSALSVGNCEIRVEHAGFRTEIRTGLNLTVSQDAVVNFVLEIGMIGQVIEVRAQPSLVNTTAGSLGGLVDEQELADLPLNGRNYVNLALMQAGIQEHKNINYTAGMTGTAFSSNGAPLRSNNYLLDGASMVTLHGISSASITGSTLGIEGIREFRVVTNGFSAEYGMTMGSQMLMVSKGGTNSFHGSLFEYLRNSVFDARNFFDYQTAASPRRLPAFARNNFGASLGGPIQKDKTFFHVVYEGLRERLGVTRVLDVIPVQAKVDALVAPVIKPLLSLFPDPNLPNTNQFAFSSSQPTDENFGQARIDHTFRTSDTAFVRFTRHSAARNGTSSYPQIKESLESRSQYLTVSENHYFSNRLLNTFRFSHSRTTIDLDTLSGLSGPQYSFVTGREIGTISIGGVSSFGGDSSTPVHHRQNIYTWSDDLYYSFGRHSLKAGALMNLYQQNMLMSTFARGSVSFANVSSFLQGKPTSYNAITPGSILDRSYRYFTLGFYAQDDWRVIPSLTLNLGLRYEFLTQPIEVQGYGAALRNIRTDAQTTLGNPFKNPSLRNLSPRVGFAWDVAGKGLMAIRGGFGLLYDIGNLGTALSAGTTATPPFSSRSTVSNPATLTLPFYFPPEVVGKSIRVMDYNIRQPHMLQYNLAFERGLPFDMALTLAYGGSRGINIVQTTEGNPTIPQILADGRQFWTGKDPRINPNWADIELKTAGGNSWYNSLQVGLVKRVTHGLQLQSAYTWSKAMDETQAQQVTENTGSSSFVSDPMHREVDRALSSFDLTHNLRVNAMYLLPEAKSVGRGVGRLLNGWWMSGILSLQSGYPFRPVIQASRTRSGINGGRTGIDRPDLVAGRSNGNIILGGPDRYFDVSAFKLQPFGFLGTAGRNILRGPGFATVDFSLAKDSPLRILGESGKLEFRAEFFNILNRANFVSPGIGIGGNSAAIIFAGRSDVESPLSTAGRITSTASTSRQIQLALKLLF